MAPRRLTDVADLWTTVSFIWPHSLPLGAPYLASSGMKQFLKFTRNNIGENWSDAIANSVTYTNQNNTFHSSLACTTYGIFAI